MTAAEVLAVDTPPEPLFYDGRTKCFNPEQFRRAMVVRGLTIDAMVLEVVRFSRRRVSRNTIIRCRAGQPVTDRTAIAVHQVLQAIPPMKVA